MDRPSVIPCFRFSTGHELWRVMDWNSFVGSLGIKVSAHQDDVLFPLNPDRTEDGVFSLVREGKPLRLLSLHRHEGMLHIVLHSALPGHPEEDPTTGLQIFRWFSFLSFREPLFWAFPDGGRWVELGAGPVDWTVEFLIPDNTEIYTFLLSAMPWILPAERFLEWLDSFRSTSEDVTDSDNETVPG